MCVVFGSLGEYSVLGKGVLVTVVVCDVRMNLRFLLV